ncbi:class I SAM-dependent methyltransferase [Streptomyces kaniharaensis]|uniref:Class I SAM-dependent methyltransferase n=1 Tax=Streptomyces kaniharaensis TaxID=212423 RepID=A0A6N7KYW4_9ACTN|nr:class I SAM-dependent methyltransferase [Streptomyces kaniharaensis]MQS14773.1 class I SAM-dependent methyltransferase [Streptomyces kaniharaensis]
MMNDAMDSGNTRRVYDLAARDYEEIFFDDLSDAHWLDSFSSSLEAPSLILDVGCGPGNFSNYLGSRGHCPVGIDISFEMLSVGRQRRGVHHPMVQGTMERLPFRSGIFDGLLIAYSLLHIPKKNVQSVLQELRRVIKANGRSLLLLKEGDDERVIAASLVAGEFLVASMWRVPELQPLLELAGWNLISAEHGEPARQEEIQEPKLALTLIAA